MSIFDAVILGLVEGLTEFLPVSSTAHLEIAGKLLGLPGGAFEKSFEIIIQFGAILAVLVLYFRKLLLDFETFKKVAVAFLPTGALGLLFYKIVKAHLLGNLAIVASALFLGGLFIIAFEAYAAKRPRENEKGSIAEISYLDAALIGCAQSVAMIPGVSRSAATILGGLALGMKRDTIVEFSFLLAVPTIAAAALLDLFKNYELFSGDKAGVLAVGFVASFISSLFVIRAFLGFIRKYSFTFFGIYRIIAAIGVAIFLIK